MSSFGGRTPRFTSWRIRFSSDPPSSKGSAATRRRAVRRSSGSRTISSAWLDSCKIYRMDLPVLDRRARVGVLRARRAQQRRLVLSAADGRARIRRRGHGAVRQPGRGVSAVLAVGHVPRPRRAGERSRCVRDELASRRAEHDSRDGESRRQLPRQPAREDGSAAQRFRRGDRAHDRRNDQRGLGAEPVPRPPRDPLHADDQRDAAPRRDALQHPHAGARHGLRRSASRRCRARCSTRPTRCSSAARRRK